MWTDARLSLIGLLVALVVTGCGESGNDSTDLPAEQGDTRPAEKAAKHNDSTKPPPRQGDPRAAEKAAKRCDWTKHNPVPSYAKAVRASFVDPGKDELRFLLEKNHLQPGESFYAAAVNDTDRPYTYGEIHALEYFNGNKWVRGRSARTSFYTIGLLAPVGGVGPCFVVQTARDAPTGRYRIVETMFPDRRPREGVRRVHTEFEVVDSPQ